MTIEAGWIKCKLGDCCDIIAGQHLGPEEYNLDGRGIPYLTGPSDFGPLTPSINRWTEVQRAMSATGDVLVTVKGSGVGKVNLGINAAIGRQLMALRPSSFLLTPYLFAWLDASFPLLAAMGQGATVPGIGKPQLSGVELPIPTLSTQARIVGKLEELLSDLDAGVAELKAAQKKLTQYRQSLLKAAVEGALTAEWRQHNHPTETGAQLLEHILTERRARWEARQLAKFEEQGKTPPKDWQKKYPEPVQPDTAELPELPEGWVWASLDMLGEIASGVAKGSKRDSNVPVREVPYLRVANVQRGYLDLSEVKSILATERDIEDLTLKDGDVLFNEGGDRDKLGRGWVWRDQVAECIHQNHVFRMRPYCPEMLSELISHHGNTFGKLWFQNVGKQTTNLASINMTMLRAFPLPIAPASEQLEILAQIEVRLDSLDRQERATDLAMNQSAAQRQNILRAAFSGQLVPQDPNDEPASALLERIRDQRGAQAGAKKPRGRKAKEASHA